MDVVKLVLKMATENDMSDQEEEETEETLANYKNENKNKSPNRRRRALLDTNNLQHDRRGLNKNVLNRKHIGLEAWSEVPRTSQLLTTSQSQPNLPNLAAKDSKSPRYHRRSPRSKNRPVSDNSLSSTDSRILLRTLQERTKNPTKLNLERTRLSRCFQVKNESDLEEINYQHNSIEVIEFVAGFTKLAFLDFYDNRIEEITGLEKLPSLKVLLLGKNQIREISGLKQVPNLNVLDLHSNLISRIENLNHLKKLQFLNLSGNLVTKVQNLFGLDSLSELNLRRNKIHFVSELDKLGHLEKLFLSYNDLNSLQLLLDNLTGCRSLTELTLDGNPLCQTYNYKTTILKSLPQLKQLDVRTITNNEREVIFKAIQKDKEKKKKAKEYAEKQQDRTNRILAAQAFWETQQIQNQLHLANLQTDRNNIDNLELQTERTVLFGNLKPSTLGEKGYAEVLRNVIKFYGKDSLGALEKDWGYTIMTNVTTAKFKFVDFDYVAQVLHRLKIKFPHVQVTDDFLTKSQAMFAPLKDEVSKLNATNRMITLNLAGHLDKKESLEDMKTLSAKQLLCLMSDSKRISQKKVHEATRTTERLLNESVKRAEQELNTERLFEKVWPKVLHKFTSEMMEEIMKYDYETYMEKRMQDFAHWCKHQKK